MLVGRQVVLGAEGRGLETQPDLPVVILEQSGALAKHSPGVGVPTEPIEGLAEREERIGALSGFTNMVQGLREAVDRGGLARRSLGEAEIDKHFGRWICGAGGVEGAAQVAHCGRGCSLTGGAASGLMQSRHRPWVPGRS